VTRDWNRLLIGGEWVEPASSARFEVICPSTEEVVGSTPEGQVRVNGAAVATDAPFGGFKHSGIGRENGPEGLAAFLEPKAIAYRPDTN
jgi:acyl-CoA reductase-like NAD-dependent aldehyde dehydrogenase